MPLKSLPETIGSLKDISFYIDTDTARTVYLLTPMEKQAIRDAIQFLEWSMHQNKAILEKLNAYEKHPSH